MPKAYALLAGSGVGTPAVRTFLDLDSTSDGGALLHALWRAHRVQGVGLAAGASSSGAVLITSDPHRSRLPFAPHAFDIVRAPSAFRNASALFELDRVVRPGGIVVAAAPASIDWAAFPQQLRAKTGLPVAAHRPEDGWAPLSTRTRGDCLGCWRFVEDLDKWVAYANATLVPVGVGSPSVRTLLDLGAGTGALAEVLWRKYGVRGAVGISRDWAGLPFMETMGSRGVLGVEADIFAPLPFPPASFDVVHSSFSGPRYAPSPAAFDAFFVEVDRVLRPGGFVVFTHWMLDGGMLDGHIDDVEARFLEIAARLRWVRHQFGVFKGEHREINLRFEKRGGRGS